MLSECREGSKVRSMVPDKPSPACCGSIAHAIPLGGLISRGSIGTIAIQFRTGKVAKGLVVCRMSNRQAGLGLSSEAIQQRSTLTRRQTLLMGGSRQSGLEHTESVRGSCLGLSRTKHLCFFMDQGEYKIHGWEARMHPILRSL